MTEVVGRNTWLNPLSSSVCEQSARLIPGQTGFNQQRANAKDGVGCTGHGYRCLPAGLAQDGLHLDLRQLSCVLRWEEKMQPAPQS